jgi:hypothetical protein
MRLDRYPRIGFHPPRTSLGTRAGIRPMMSPEVMGAADHDRSVMWVSWCGHMGGNPVA